MCTQFWLLLIVTYRTKFVIPSTEHTYILKQKESSSRFMTAQTMRENIVIVTVSMSIYRHSLYNLNVILIGWSRCNKATYLSAIQSVWLVEAFVVYWLVWWIDMLNSHWSLLTCSLNIYIYRSPTPKRQWINNTLFCNGGLTKPTQRM